MSDPSRKAILAATERYLEAIKAALLNEWDPIGVKQFRRPKDEVVDYLWWLETKHMGLTGDRQATERFAERLMRIPREIED